MIAVFFATGFEEVEALATVDLLRRAGVEVSMVGVGVEAGEPVCGAHHIQIMPDQWLSDFDVHTMSGLVLPGGMPGTRNLEASSVVMEAIAYAVRRKLPIGAICAAPSVLGHAGYLKGVEATCYPGFEEDLRDALLSNQAVVTSGLFTTASGAGVAIDFALELISRLVSPEKANEIREAIQCP